MTKVNSDGNLQHSNPFDSDLARTNSSYAAFQQNKLVRVLDPDVLPSPLTQLVHDSFRALVLSSRFSCVGAKAAIHRGDYRMGMYGEMNSIDATAGLSRDLFAFVEEQNKLNSIFTTFIASFVGPYATDEEDFERHLWAQLQALHDQDALYHTWDSSVASNPEHPNFSFSFAGRAFFIVGLSPASSRWTRRFAWPTLIFNAHYQFERLRELGKYKPLQKAIRLRENVLQGTISPTLSDFGQVSEARQYAGRTVEQEWKCPFSAHPHEERF
ncbi:MAG: YqcI/YcgG family protein [Ktedonobacteraceae bacterium]|nr:YqcI/YcgG family protein [Ktedonobacteraceae bacterium]